MTSRTTLLSKRFGIISNGGLFRPKSPFSIVEGKRNEAPPEVDNDEKSIGHSKYKIVPFIPIAHTSVVDALPVIGEIPVVTAEVVDVSLEVASALDEAEHVIDVPNYYQRSTTSIQSESSTPTSSASSPKKVVRFSDDVTIHTVSMEPQAIESRKLSEEVIRRLCYPSLESDEDDSNEEEADRSVRESQGQVAHINNGEKFPMAFLWDSFIVTCSNMNMCA